jgi:glycopeptide antibiotics resistance protein
MDRISPGVIAVVVGLVLCLVLLTPWVARQYRTRGAVTMRGGISAIATVVACAALATYTLMPLPAPWTMTCTRPAGVQVVPFAFVADTVRHPGAIVQVLFNVALFAPVGYLLARRRTRHPVLVTTVVGAAISLTIELTQLTAVWGLWPCAFRVFDADDLIANTAGAAVGAWLATTARIPRNRDRRARRAADRTPDAPRAVTAGRRLLGTACDAAMLVAGGWIAGLLAVTLVAALRLHPDDVPATVVGLAAPVLSTAGFVTWSLVHRRTPGEAAVRLRATDRPGWLPMSGRLALGAPGWFLLSSPALGVQSSIGTDAMPWFGPALGAVAVVAAFVTPGHRGLGAWATGIVVDDDRRPAARARRAALRPGRVPRGLGAGIAAVAVAVVLATTVAAFPIRPLNGSIDPYSVPERFSRAFTDVLTHSDTSPLRGVVLDRDLSAEVLHGDLGTLGGLLGWLLLGITY